MDLGIAERQVDRWTKNLPRIKPHYAVKCNPDEYLLKTLVNKGINFDCASGDEIHKALNAGAKASQIIFANPIKTILDLKLARSLGISKMTFDNADEVLKIQKYYPDADLIIRLLVSDSGSLMPFGTKFGTPIQSVPNLLQLCQKQNMNIIGTSFHIGSGCLDPNQYTGAIEQCRKTFDIAKSMGISTFKILDIGGGFCGSIENNRFESFSDVIRKACDQYFPEDLYSNVQIISEPGRYFATSCKTLFTMVQGKREVREVNNEKENTNKKFLYYINDGVYGSFNCKVWDYYHPVPITMDDFFGNDSRIQMLKLNGVRQYSTNSTSTISKNLSTFFGPTCDSMDLVIKDHRIRELFLGDQVVFKNMGAYTKAAGVAFNGCPLPIVKYIRSDQ
jgi:ornithine decarboxylase